jgi:hypothetical protein
MSTRGFKRIAVFAGSAALAAGAVAGCGSDSPAASTASARTEQQTGTRLQGRGGPGSSALAAELGVSTSKLEAAMQAIRPAQGGSPDDMAASLAKELGLSTAKVKAALAAVRPSGAPPADRQAPPSGTPAAGSTSS